LGRRDYIQCKFPDNENPAQAVRPFKGLKKLCLIGVGKDM